MAVLCAAANYQLGNTTLAHLFARLAKEWGASRKLIGNTLVAGTQASIDSAIAATRRLDVPANQPTAPSLRLEPAFSSDNWPDQTTLSNRTADPLRDAGLSRRNAYKSYFHSTSDKKRHPPRVAIAGIPRCGTTMVFRAIAGLSPGTTTPHSYSGPHLKTHTFEPASLIGRIDVAIFLFGDVADAVVSTRLKRYDMNHFRNCGSGHLSPTTTDIYEADYLNYERMFDAWMAPLGIPHVCIRYSRLHELSPIAESLIGVAIPLPPRTPRVTKVPQDIRFRIEKTYHALVSKIERAPDISYYT
jgi:hypothetical protein